jgi:hypothetical protein
MFFFLQYIFSINIVSQQSVPLLLRQLIHEIDEVTPEEEILVFL